MSQMITKNSNQAIASYGRDPFERLADDMAPRTILGQLIKFSKGDYLVGQDNTIVPSGAVFLAAVDHALGGWIHWGDRRPDQQIMLPLASGRVPPPRHTLGDNDENTWDVIGNDRRDPWQETYYLPLLSADDELFTFTTSSAGGKRAVGDLFREYGRQRRTGGDVYPQILLGVQEYPHRTYGRLKKPEFSITGWEPRARFLDALEVAGITPLDFSQPAESPPKAPAFVPNARARAGASLADEMDDSIPF